MATTKLTREEKIELFKIQCRRLEYSAEMLVSDNYDIEPVIKMSNYDTRSCICNNSFDNFSSNSRNY